LGRFWGVNVGGRWRSATHAEADHYSNHDQAYRLDDQPTTRVVGRKKNNSVSATLIHCVLPAAFAAATGHVSLSAGGTRARRYRLLKDLSERLGAQERYSPGCGFRVGRLQPAGVCGLKSEHVPNIHFLLACRRNSGGVDSGLFGKLDPNANFKEKDKDEDQSCHSRNNCQQLAMSEVAYELINCAQEDFAVWHDGINSTPHSRRYEPQSCASNNGFKQLASCTQQRLALRHFSSSSTPNSRCNRNLCHCSIHSVRRM